MIEVDENLLKDATDWCSEYFVEEGNLLTKEENDYLIETLLAKIEKQDEQYKIFKEEVEENYRPLTKEERNAEYN